MELKQHSPVRRFGRAHGRRSHGNLSHLGGSQVKAERIEYAKDAPDGQCWGCWQNRRDPWEHDTTCPRWQVRLSECSGA